MDQHRPKLHEFQATVGPPSHDLPACREVIYSLSLTDEHGDVVRRDHTALLYEGLLGDSDQVPWLVAHALRTLFRESELESPTGPANVR